MNLKTLLNKENPVIIEIGANDGSDTVSFYRDFTHPKVICFEPDERAMKEFSKRQLPAFTLKAALSDQNGKIDFYPSTGRGQDWNKSGSILKPLEHLHYYSDIQFLSPVKVQTITLDSFIHACEIPHIDLIWMDVQGAEEKVILGGQETFAHRVNYLLTEFSKCELYEGCPGKERILELLPNFKLVEIVWEGEVEGNMLLKAI